MGHIGTGWQIDSQLVFVAFFLVVLRDPLSHLSSGNTNDGVPGSVEGWFAAEDLDSDDALFENVSVSLGCLRHHKAQKV